MAKIKECKVVGRKVYIHSRKERVGKDHGTLTCTQRAGVGDLSRYDTRGYGADEEPVNWTRKERGGGRSAL